VALLGAPEPELRGFASLALCRAGRPAVGALRDAMEGDDEPLATCAALTLARIGEPAAEEALRRLGERDTGEKG
jgi:HEAT repeat protein